MITWALETSTTTGAFAWLDEDRPVREIQFGRDGLFPALQQIQPPRADLIVVGVGPGSFTGIRAGIAAAKGLALTHDTPLRAVSSFDALAVTVAPQMPRECAQMCLFSDARRDEIYFAVYDRQGRPVRDVTIGTWEMVADEIHAPLWFASPEIEKYRAEIRQCFGGFATLAAQPVFPCAAALGWLGRQPSTPPRALEPIYLRVAEYQKTG
jgi:tRNA threonylcarbamoyl adenosine modification protein YeaZ